jgi:hypothetical protein
MAPCVQVIVVQLTPASLMWEHVDKGELAGQLISLVSVPRHWTLDRQIAPLPLVKPDVVALAPGIGWC